MTRAVPAAVERWHDIVARHDPALLGGLLAPEVVFRSPAVFAPQAGIERTTAYLSAALAVLGPSLTYEREWYAGDSAVLEFTADLGGVSAHGVDLLRWNDGDLLVEFTVMVRPLRGLTTLIELMGAELARQAG
jgi:hypothetical protein